MELKVDHRYPTSNVTLICYTHNPNSSPNLWAFSTIHPLLSVSSFYKYFPSILIWDPSFLSTQACWIVAIGLGTIWDWVSILSLNYAFLFACIYSFIPSSVFVEYLLCTRYGVGYWEYSWKQSIENPCSSEAQWKTSSLSLSSLTYKIKTTSILQVYHKDTMVLRKCFTNPDLTELRGIEYYKVKQVHMPNTYWYIIRAQ